MATHYFIDNLGADTSVAAITTDDGKLLLSLTCYPMSALYAMPMSVAVRLEVK